MPSKEAYAKAKAGALKALELDPTLAEAHAGLAWIQWRFEWDWEGAERGFKHAIELEANNANAHRFYAAHLAAMGRNQEALVEGRRAQELDPLTLRIMWNLGSIYFLARQYEQATRNSAKHSRWIRTMPWLTRALQALICIWEGTKKPSENLERPAS